MERQIDEMIRDTPDDRELAEKLGALGRKSWEFGNAASKWAPTLYYRNRRVFLPLIEQYASTWTLRGAKNLGQWMDDVERNGDNRLFRVLYQMWLTDTHGWSDSARVWANALITRAREAPDRAARRDVLERYDLWYDLEDEHAVELYRLDPTLTRDFVIKRLDRERWYDVVYEELAEVARAAGDEDFYFDLYRRTFAPDTWLEDVLELCDAIADPVRLNRELEKRHLTHPEGGVDPAGYLAIFRKRGKDVAPYLRRNVPNTESWGSESLWRDIARHAESVGAWDVWGATVRSQYQPSMYSEVVQGLASSGEQDHRVLAKLLQLVGATHGWAQWRQTTALTVSAATALYKRFPELVRGPFSAHVIVTPRESYEKLASIAAAAGDDALIDRLAAKALNAHHQFYWDRGPIETLGWYVQYFRGLKKDPTAFAERAFNVLSGAEPFSKYSRAPTRRFNPLYELFFDDPTIYLPSRPRVRDLLEAPNDDARLLGLRILTARRDDESARLAAQNADHLIAYIIEEALRGTRIVAFDALALAAQTSETLARMILERAQEGFDLRRREYPRDRLVELVGRVLHLWPNLRRPTERPVVYGLERGTA